MDPIKIIQKFYKIDSVAYGLLVPHSQAVAQKALEIARRVPQFWKKRVCRVMLVGMGISAQDIEAQNLPLPKRDMTPVSIEEKIICFADKFFSKSKGKDFLMAEKSVEQVRESQMRFNPDKVKVFDEWLELFGY